MRRRHAGPVGAAAMSRCRDAPRSGNFAGTTIPDYTVANFRISLDDEAAGWSLTANLKNACDRTYYVGGLSAGEIFQVNILGIGDSFVRSSPVIGLLRDGRVIDIDISKPWSLPFTPALTFSGKWQFLHGLWRSRKMLASVDSFKLKDVADQEELENAQVFGARIFGREVTDYVLDPLCRLVIPPNGFDSCLAQ